MQAPGLQAPGNLRKVVIQMLNVKDFRMERNLKSDQLVKVIREKFPKYDKYLQSKIERPAEYGVRLVHEAEALLEDAFIKTTPTPHKRARRQLPQRIQCRLSTTNYEGLQQAFKQDGFDTVQAGLTYIIHLYLNKEEQHGTNQ